MRLEQASKVPDHKVHWVRPQHKLPLSIMADPNAVKGVEGFDVKKLKKTTTVVKNPLPTKECVLFSPCFCDLFGRHLAFCKEMFLFWGVT